MAGCEEAAVVGEGAGEGWADVLAWWGPARGRGELDGHAGLVGVVERVLGVVDVVRRGGGA